MTWDSTSFISDFCFDPLLSQIPLFDSQVLAWCDTISLFACGFSFDQPQVLLLARTLKRVSWGLKYTSISIPYFVNLLMSLVLPYLPHGCTQDLWSHSQGLDICSTFKGGWIWIILLLLVFTSSLFWVFHFTNLTHFSGCSSIYPVDIKWVF